MTTPVVQVYGCSSARRPSSHVASEGWSLVLSGLKTLLETGEALVVAKAG